MGFIQDQKIHKYGKDLIKMKSQRLRQLTQRYKKLLKEKETLKGLQIKYETTDEKEMIRWNNQRHTVKYVRKNIQERIGYIDLYLFGKGGLQQQINELQG